MPKFLTTPIYYVNDVPHIGHAYCTLATDTLARYWRQQLGNDQVFFLTGTDENSQKTVEAAQKAGLPIEQYLDQMAAQWQTCWDQIGISYDDFIRTTEERHQKTVQSFLQKLLETGHVYKGTYKGLYCTGCESFKKPSDLDEENNCPDHRKPCQELQEENYFFRLSAFEKELIELYEREPHRLEPTSRRNEIMQFLREGLDDISISRETAEIGIPMPNDPKQKIYVWIDALINYYTAVQTPERQDLWQEAFHIVGKDITRFHSVIWPAMHLAIGSPIPTGVYAHGFFTIDGHKMSKSLGNVISPLALKQKYGNDALRLGLLSSFEFGNDGDFSLGHFDRFYQAKLAGGLGNLFNRVVILIHKFLDGQIPAPSENIDQNELLKPFQEALENKKIKTAIDYFFSVVDQANQRLNETEPWKLAKTDLPTAAKVFTELYGYLTFLSKMSEILLPESAEKMKRMLGDGQNLGQAEILFPSVN